MEMERINEDVIKVLIDIQDLKDRGVDFLDLIGDQRSIEQFFYSILEEVDTDRHFQESDTLAFQVIPNLKGLELYISRNSFDNLATFLEQSMPNRFRRRIQTQKSEDEMPWDEALALEDNVELERNTAEIVAFNRLNDFLVAAKAMPSVAVQSTLYSLNDRFFVALGDVGSEISDKKVYGYYAALLEYGFPFPVTEAVLREYGEVIRQDDAIEFFAQL